MSAEVAIRTTSITGSAIILSVLLAVDPRCAVSFSGFSGMWSETVASALFGIELMTVACTPTMRPGARLCSLYGSFRKEGYRVNAARKASRASSGLFFAKACMPTGLS